MLNWCANICATGLICFGLFFFFNSGSKNMSQITTNGENEGTTKIIAPSPVKRYVDPQLPYSF